MFRIRLPLSSDEFTALFDQITAESFYGKVIDSESRIMSIGVETCTVASCECVPCLEHFETAFPSSSLAAYSTHADVDSFGISPRHTDNISSAWHLIRKSFRTPWIFRSFAF